MALKLMYITNDEKIAGIAEECGVNWIFIDLEINGKEARQGHMDTVISRHSIDDVRKIKQVLTTSKLLVRVNPIYEGSKDEIDQVIYNGADIIMLPMFKTKDEVESFIEFVAGRAKVCLLCETAEAVENIDAILSVNGIDFIHIGLNDLHLDYNKRFMFELVADGTVEMLSKKFKSKAIPFGFGGIARLGEGKLPAEYIIGEHYRLGSSMAILSRRFCDVNKMQDLDEIRNIFKEGVKGIRDYERRLSKERQDYFESNRVIVKMKVDEIKNNLD